MISVANINGKEVFSDKQLTGVQNTKVTFSDGSWCDVTTGQVVNNGPGYISIGSDKVESSLDERKESFIATSVEVSSISSDVDIQPYGGKEIQVSLSGPKDDIDRVTIGKRGDAVYIEGDSADGGSSVNITGGSFLSNISVSGSVVISNGNVSISTGRSAVSTSILVPLGTPLILVGVRGKAVIGDTLGPIRLSVRGGFDSKIGSISNGDFSIHGSGDVQVGWVNGNHLTVNIHGSGDVDVNGGSVEDLRVEVHGSGDVAYGGRAVNADLSVMGSGDIEVFNVKNRPTKRTMGSGEIEVGNW